MRICIRRMVMPVVLVIQPVSRAVVGGGGGGRAWVGKSVGRIRVGAGVVRGAALVQLFNSVATLMMMAGRRVCQ